MSEGLRRELKPFGIDVVILAPGMVGYVRTWFAGRAPHTHLKDSFWVAQANCTGGLSHDT